MNTIERAEIIDDRVFLKVHFGKEDNTVKLRFYVPEKKEDFIEQFGIALNRPFLLKPEAEWKELGIEDEFLHEDIIKSAVSSLKDDFRNCFLSGVFQKKRLQLTTEGQTFFAFYKHYDTLRVRYAFYYKSLEETLLNTLEMRSGKNKEYRFKGRKEYRTTFDFTIVDSLYSIDRVSDLLLYKRLDDYQMSVLVKKGLGCLTI